MIANPFGKSSYDCSRYVYWYTGLRDHFIGVCRSLDRILYGDSLGRRVPHRIKRWIRGVHRWLIFDDDSIGPDHYIGIWFSFEHREHREPVGRGPWPADRGPWAVDWESIAYVTGSIGTAWESIFKMDCWWRQTDTILITDGRASPTQYWSRV